MRPKRQERRMLAPSPRGAENARSAQIAQTLPSSLNRGQGIVKLDPSAKPKAMDITGTESPNKGEKIPAIFALGGDRLKVCYDLSGKSRLKEFKTVE